MDLYQDIGNKPNNFVPGKLKYHTKRRNLVEKIIDNTWPKRHRSFRPFNINSTDF